MTTCIEEACNLGVKIELSLG